MRKILSLIFFLFTLCKALHAQKTSVSASLDKDSILIGEPFHLLLEARFPLKSGYAWFRLDSLANFEVLSVSPPDSMQSGDTLIRRQSFAFTVWDSGRKTIPSLTLKKGFKTKPLSVHVFYANPDTTRAYFDIREIIEVPPPPRRTWYWYVLGLLFLVGLFFLFFPPGKKKAVAVPVPDEGIYRKTLKQLEELRVNREIKKDPKEFYTVLIDLFRGYLYKRKGIQSYSRTTDDLAVQLQSLHLDKNEYSTVVQTLRLSDLVKFAKYIPPENELLQSVDVISKAINSIENLK